MFFATSEDRLQELLLDKSFAPKIDAYSKAKSAKNDDECKALLAAFKFPFKN